MSNRLAKPPKGQAREYYGRPEKQLFNRLDALLMVLKTCKQDSCRNAWWELFPGHNVNSLEDAMDKKYDKFFAKQPKVKFAHCIGGDIREKSGPQKVISFK